MFNTQSRDHQSKKPDPTRPENVAIPQDELDLSYARSGGPGGQKVNKTSSKVVLKWDFWASKVLSVDQKMAIQRDNILSNRMNSDGVIVLHEQQTRSQDDNRRLAIEKLHDLVRSALTPKPERIETKIPASKKRARVDDKKHQSRKKDGRGRDYSGDY